MAKYFNKKVVYDGIKFDSKLERDRYKHLKSLESLGCITNLELQVPFELLEGCVVDNFNLKTWKRKRIAPITYKADFTYTRTSDKVKVIEDTKGYPTNEYKLKLKLLINKLKDSDIVFNEVSVYNE